MGHGFGYGPGRGDFPSPLFLWSFHPVTEAKVMETGISGVLPRAMRAAPPSAPFYERFFMHKLDTIVG